MILTTSRFTFAVNTTIIMNEPLVSRIKKELQDIEAAGLYKRERIITSEQGPEIEVNGKRSSVSQKFADNIYVV